MNFMPKSVLYIVWIRSPPGTSSCWNILLSPVLYRIWVRTSMMIRNHQTLDECHDCELIYWIYKSISSLQPQCPAVAFPACDLFSYDLHVVRPYLGLASPAYEYILVKSCLRLWKLDHELFTKTSKKWATFCCAKVPRFLSPSYSAFTASLPCHWVLSNIVCCCPRTLGLPILPGSSGRMSRMSLHPWHLHCHCLCSKTCAVFFSIIGTSMLSCPGITNSRFLPSIMPTATNLTFAWPCLPAWCLGIRNYWCDTVNDDVMPFCNVRHSLYSFTHENHLVTINCPIIIIRIGILGIYKCCAAAKTYFLDYGYPYISHAASMLFCYSF